MSESQGEVPNDVAEGNVPASPSKYTLSQISEESEDAGANEASENAGGDEASEEETDQEKFLKLNDWATYKVCAADYAIKHFYIYTRQEPKPLMALVKFLNKYYTSEGFFKNRCKIIYEFLTVPDYAKKWNDKIKDNYSKVHLNGIVPGNFVLFFFLLLLYILFCYIYCFVIYIVIVKIKC